MLPRLFAIGLLLLLATLGWGAESEAIHFAEVVEDISATNAPEGNRFARWLLTLLSGPITAIIFGILVIGMMLMAWRGRYHWALLMTLVMIMLAFVRVVVLQDTGDQGFFGHDAASVPSDGSVDFYVFAGDEGSGIHRSSRAPAYEVVRGWALHGAMFCYELLDFGFDTLIIPTVIVVGAYMSIIAAMMTKDKFRQAWIIISFILFVGLIGTASLIPWTELNTPGEENPVLALSQDDAQSRRVPPLAVFAFEEPTRIAESLTQRFGTPLDGEAMVIQAALAARLSSDQYNRYSRYSTTCLTMAQNFMATANAEPDRTTPWGEFVTRKLGPRNQKHLGGLYGEYQKEPIYNRHALSYASGAILGDIPMLRFYPLAAHTSDRYFEMEENFELALSKYNAHQGQRMVIDLPDEGDAHPTALGDSPYTTEPIIDMVDMYVDDWSKIFPPMPANHKHDRVWFTKTKHPHYETGSSRVVVAACASMAQDLNWNAAENEVGFEMPPFWYDVVFHGSATDATGHLGASLYDDMAAYIAKDYVLEEANNLCDRVSVDRNVDRMWGCLVAGRFTYPPDETADDPWKRALAQAQTVFRDKYAPRLQDLTADQMARYGVHAGLDRQRYLDVDMFADRSRWQSNPYSPVNRTFCDLYMLAPGVQQQVGLIQELRNAGDLAYGKNDNSDESILDMLVDFGGKSVMEFVSWIAGIVAEFSARVWPTLMGVGIAFMLAVFPMYATMSMIPGKHRLIFDWMISAVWVSIWPVFITLGLDRLEAAAAENGETFFLAATGSNEWEVALLRLVGAAMILGSPLLAQGVVVLGLASLQGAVNQFVSFGWGYVNKGGAVALAAASAVPRIGSQFSQIARTVK